MSGEYVKDFLARKQSSFINDNFFDRYENVYDDVVISFFQKTLDKHNLVANKSLNDLKKLRKLFGVFEEEGGEILDIYEEAQRLAEEEDEEEQRDEWEMNQDDEEFDEGEFEYEPNFEQQAYYFENHLLDLAAQHSKDLGGFAKSSIRYARMRNVHGLDFINIVYGKWDELAKSYEEVIENRIKVEKQWLKILKKNIRNIIKALFEDVDLEEAWDE